MTTNEAIQSLARAVILRAVEDMLLGHMQHRQPSVRNKPTSMKKNLLAKLSAIEFLTSEDYQVWADAAGMDLDVDMVFEAPQRIKKILENR